MSGSESPGSQLGLRLDARSSAHVTTRATINTIANRTLISDETNQKISDKAAADYLADPDIFPLEPDRISSVALPRRLDRSADGVGH